MAGARALDGAAGIAVLSADGSDDNLGRHENKVGYGYGFTPLHFTVFWWHFARPQRQSGPGMPRPQRLATARAPLLAGPSCVVSTIMHH